MCKYFLQISFTFAPSMMNACMQGNLVLKEINEVKGGKNLVDNKKYKENVTESITFLKSIEQNIK
ncbi:MAG: hypothetical protein HXX18_09265 [Bacteroidetes bacterium]|nr:hypothetical protein [Bacteroidota bacterium]